MAYDPDNHHRKSLRLPDYDYTAEGIILLPSAPISGSVYLAPLQKAG
jgi:hypothetical protein